MSLCPINVFLQHGSFHFATNNKSKANKSNIVLWVMDECALNTNARKNWRYLVYLTDFTLWTTALQQSNLWKKVVIICNIIVIDQVGPCPQRINILLWFINCKTLSGCCRTMACVVALCRYAVCLACVDPQYKQVFSKHANIQWHEYNNLYANKYQLARDIFQVLSCEHALHTPASVIFLTSFHPQCHQSWLRYE